MNKLNCFITILIIALLFLVAVRFAAFLLILFFKGWFIFIPILIFAIYYAKKKGIKPKFYHKNDLNQNNESNLDPKKEIKTKSKVD